MHESEQKVPESHIPAQTNSLSIPVAIIVAGVLIAGALFFGLKSNGGSQVANAPQPQGVAQPTGDLDQMKAISKSDHIRGNPDAPVKIVEYSDTECGHSLRSLSFELELR